MVWGIPDGDLQDPWGDAITYLSAGERLNAGHPLYELQPGDRPVLILPTYTAPLLSPPPIAAIWRALAAAPFGFVLWIAACWLALLGSVWFLVMRIGLPAAVLAAVLSWPIGEQLAAANVSAFIPVLLLITWVHRGDARLGAILGALAAIKLSPAVMGGWWIGHHRGHGVLSFFVGLAVLAALGLWGAGWDAHVAYVGIAGTTDPSDLSIAGRLGAPWFPFVSLLVGTAIAGALGRYPRLSFGVAYGAMLVATPAVYVATFSLLIGFLVPFVDRARVRETAAL